MVANPMDEKQYKYRAIQLEHSTIAMMSVVLQHDSCVVAFQSRRHLQNNILNSEQWKKRLQQVAYQQLTMEKCVVATAIHSTMKNHRLFAILSKIAYESHTTKLQTIVIYQSRELS
jgi:hypothetical protein